MSAPLRVAILRPGSSVQSASSASTSDDGDCHSLASSSDYASSLSSSTAPTSLASRSSISEPASSPVERKAGDRPSYRKNEHLAVLLPKHLWKSDASATRCETFGCPTAFSVFQRRHHCRKCGGIFCSACTTRSTPLLDTHNLHFLHPPRNVPISVLESPISPIITSKVCDDCYQQIHNLRSRPMPSSASAEDVPSTNSNARPRPQLRRSNTGPVRQRRTMSVSSPISPASSTGSSVVTNEKSYGELDSYPLRNASAVCKATGGGRWTPRQVMIPNSRLHGSDLLVDADDESHSNPRSKKNPVLRHGDFHIRVPVAFEPRSPQGPPLLPTF
ncbi:hypothetical protein OE88DRAFT_1738061 [Heliocybe sulcata]|uniref:FYVE-type domain-containing protein n=1 Tax=Heliocybe sulcata TaxID=5364 RepID=A0A5C3MSB3_9AGAM|nr:hypothetical protein OE88DRAFT_1738061 [Heliocybe sulcata]